MIRLAALCLLLGCRPASVQPEPAESVAAASTSPASTASKPALVPEATLVVVGTVTRLSTRDGHAASLRVSRVLRGVPGEVHEFVSAPLPIDVDVERVYFLVPDAGGMRALPLEGRISAPLSVERALEAEPKPAPPPPPAAFDADLALLRAHDQSDWSPRARPAKVAAARVFGAVPWIGRSSQNTVELLGPPSARRDRDDGAQFWVYAYHTGEHGVMRWLLVRDDHVASMWLVPTQ